MANIIPTILFEQPFWLMAIPVVIIGLAIIFWRKPLILEAWQQPLESAGKNIYYLPMANLLEEDLQKKKKTSKVRLFLSQYIKYLFFFIMILIALAQPYQKGQQLPQPPLYRDIVFLVDTSVTMSLKDYQFNDKRVERLIMLKSVLSHFIEKLHGSRIGITVFSERAYTLAPLTTDYPLLKTQLHRLESAVLTGRTSDPANALLYTAKQYQTNSEKPALIMLTDINRPARQVDPRIAAKYLAQQGFHLHTIGIGAGSQSAEDKDISSLIYQPANFHLLEEIATAGKGQFFWANDIASLNAALQSIQGTEKRSIAAQPEFIKEPLYMLFVIAALCWVSFWQIIPLLRMQP